MQITGIVDDVIVNEGDSTPLVPALERIAVALEQILGKLDVLIA